MWYLIEIRGLRQAVVKTVNMTAMIDRLGERYGVPVFEVPVGFKYIAPKTLETGAMMGGEESGGFGFAMHLPERDGIVADLFLLDFMLKTKKTPSELVRELMDLAGPSFYLRRDVHFATAAYPTAKLEIMARLDAAAPTELAGIAVARVAHLDTKDGAKFFRTDGSWLLVRLSGTEPLVRVYAETRSEKDLPPLLDAGQRLLGGLDGPHRDRDRGRDPPRDVSNMLDRIRSCQKQRRDARRSRAQPLPPHYGDVRQIVVLGIGGSASAPTSPRRSWRRAPGALQPCTATTASRRTSGATRSSSPRPSREHRGDALEASPRPARSARILVLRPGCAQGERAAGIPVLTFSYKAQPRGPRLLARPRARRPRPARLRARSRPGRRGAIADLAAGRRVPEERTRRRRRRSRSSSTGRSPSSTARAPSASWPGA